MLTRRAHFVCSVVLCFVLINLPNPEIWIRIIRYYEIHPEASRWCRPRSSCLNIVTESSDGAYFIFWGELNFMPNMSIAYPQAVSSEQPFSVRIDFRCRFPPVSKKEPDSKGVCAHPPCYAVATWKAPGRVWGLSLRWNANRRAWQCVGIPTSENAHV